MSVNYSTQQLFDGKTRVWGFGAKYYEEVPHFFTCGENPTATGIEGVLQAYRVVYRSVLVNDLTMAEPTVILSVLRAAAQRAEKFVVPSNSTNPKKDLRYCVLLIMTYGVVSDLARTQEIIQSYRDLPLSIVMVGIGRADFTEMHKWNTYPFDTRGRFSFADYRQHKYSSMSLSQEALQQVSLDVRDYFLGRGVFP